MSERIKLYPTPPQPAQRHQELAERRLTVSLTIADWQVAARLLAQAPYAQVYRILEQIEQQAQEADRFNTGVAEQLRSEAALRTTQLQAEQAKTNALDYQLKRAREDAQSLHETNERLRKEIARREEQRRKSDGRRRGRKPKAPTEERLVS